MSAPWGIELYKNVLGGIVGDFVEVFADEDAYAVVEWLSWDFLGFVYWGKFASLKVGNYLLDAVDGDATFGLVFLDAFGTWLYNKHTWHVFCANTKVLSESRHIWLADISIAEENLRLYGWGCLLVNCMGFISVLAEKEKSWVALAEN